MRPIVARSQTAMFIWQLWSEVTGTLPNVTVIRENEVPPADSYIIHCPTTHLDAAAAEYDLLDHPDKAIVCGVSRLDEEITIAPSDRIVIDDLWKRFGATGRLFGTVGCAAEWMLAQREPVLA